MSVYTELTHHEISDFINNYAFGPLKTFHGITAGVTNTIYYIETMQSAFVLTIFEELTAAELPFYLDLIDFLAEKQLPCPHIIANKQNKRIFNIKNKPAVLMQYLPGETLTQTNQQQCQAIAKSLANLHLLTIGFPQHHSNPRGSAWREKIAETLDNTLDKDNKIFLREEINFAHQHNLEQLPQGIIHADLFRDNVLFLGNKITGLLDFYYACGDALSYDLAIVVNDWCFTTDNEFDEGKYIALLNSYQSIRPFTESEKQCWLATLRQAALRFWLSRLHDEMLHECNPLIQKKDPKIFKKRIEFYRNNKFFHY